MTALFIGVVSHGNSRFAVSQGPGGLARQLETHLSSAGVDVHVQVNTADAYDPGPQPVTDEMVQASLTEQLHLDRRWAVYLGGGRGPKWWAMHGARWMKRGQQTLRSPGPRMVERLLNIELSHFDLLRRGVLTGSDWTLVLEDDAWSADVADCAAGVLALMADRDAAGSPAYVNVSHSFSNEELRITHLLSTVADTRWGGGVDRKLLSASRPVTNTVCAILYRTAFAEQLLATMEALPLEPVVPIDWKLNIALMQMYDSGALGDGSCWLVEPAPIDQLSMRPEPKP